MGENKASFYKNLAYVASIIMIIGANLPLYLIKGTSGEIEAVDTLNNESVLLFISALITIIISYYNMRKYFIIPIICQMSIMIYFVVSFIKCNEFEMVHVGFVLEVLAVICLIITMFIDIENIKTDTQGMRLLEIKSLQEDNYGKVLVKSDIKWIVLTIILAGLMLVYKIKTIV